MRSFGHIIDVSKDTKQGNIQAAVLQLNDGNLVAGGINSTLIQKSIDGGNTWVTKYTHTAVFVCRTMYQDSRGYIYCSINIAGQFGQLMRSTDDGETWSSVLTAESDAFWKVIEDTSHNLYVNEYNLSATTFLAFNIWQSTDGGATWTKWYHYPGVQNSQTTIRHIHFVYRDSSNNFYTGFGDLLQGFTGADVGKSFQLDASGNYVQTISTSGNGMVGMIQSDDGRLFLLGDFVPGNGIYTYSPGHPVTETMILSQRFGSLYDSHFEVAPLRGKDGVLYALLHSATPSLPGVLLASVDNGTTWYCLKFTSQIAEDRCFTLSTSISNSRLYISFKDGVNYMTLPDYTKNQIQNLVNANKVTT